MLETISMNWFDFGGSGPNLHFAHANGYPPAAYTELFARLKPEYHVFASNARPLWPDADPQEIQDWLPMADDLLKLIEAQPPARWIGVGHSMGATNTLRAALHAPERFQALVLIDPVLFPRWISLLWELIYRTGLAYRLHPLASGALRRRTEFESLAAMQAHYRQKSVFSRMDDQNLQAYIEALTQPGPDGNIHLVYPPEWEARIYVTSARKERELWRHLPNLLPPVLLLRGAETETFFEQTARLFKRRLPQTTLYSVPGAGHLLPLEKPGEVAAIMLEFLRSRVTPTG
jgi:pimeloyl-ACP methyl ester carboxylesterase